MPYGCRVGICHTCTVTKISGTVRDLRNGAEFDQPNEQVQTCVTVPVGPCVLNIYDRRRMTMAIADVKEYCHLTPEEVEQIGAELDAIRVEIEDSRGAKDAAYINRVITHPALDGRGRPDRDDRQLAAGQEVRRPVLAASAISLGLAKILENMEIGHNVMHGQWDWMNDPEIHSSTWEWDTGQPAEQWKHSHNYIHHQFTNVLGYDNDIGYGVLRMAREQKWHPVNLGQPVYNALLASLFQWGVVAARPRHRGHPQGQEGPEGDEAAAQADRQEGPQPDPQGLRALPGALGQAVEVDDEGQRAAPT